MGSSHVVLSEEGISHAPEGVADKPGTTTAAFAATNGRRGNTWPPSKGQAGIQRVKERRTGARARSETPGKGLPIVKKAPSRRQPPGKTPLGADLSIPQRTR